MIKRFRGSLLLLTAAVIWGTAFVAQSEGMRYVEPFTYNAIRTLLGGLVLIPVICGFRLAGRRNPDAEAAADPAVTRKGGLCCGVLLFAASSLQQAGIALTTAGKAGFLTALYVVLVPLLSVFLQRRMPKRMWLCIAAAVAGFWLLCIREGFTVNRGDLLVLASAFFYALHIMTVDHFCGLRADGKVMSCMQFFTAGTLMTVCMLLFEHPVLQNILAAKGTILYAGIMSCGAAYTFQILGQRETAPALATLLMSLESVFAALSGWLILKERLSAKELAGCALVFGAVIAAQLLTTGPANTSNRKD